MALAHAYLFQTILADRSDPALDEQFPFYPLTAPGMGVPGPNFIANAVAMGDAPPTLEGRKDDRRCLSYGKNLHYLYRRALYDEQFTLQVNVKGRWVTAQLVPGHLLGDDTRDYNGGPRRARVMIIGKNPGAEEVLQRRNFVGPTSMELFNALDVLGVGEAERSEWYVTNLVKWPQLDRQSDSLPVAQLADNRVLLEEELRLVQPDYILCLGSHASKSLLGTQYSVSAMVGRVETHTYPIFDTGEEPTYKTAKVMTVTHPAQIYRLPELFDAFKDQIGMFLQLISGADVGGEEHDVDHRVVYTESQLRRIVDEIRADPSRWFIAADAEWHGDHPNNPGSYLRTVQFSSRHKEGICVVLRYQGGAPAFQPSIGHAIHQLRRLFLPDQDAGYYPRVGGWFFRADMPWLIHSGIDLRPHYAPPEDPMDHHHGGWDASLMYHAVRETASFKLEDVAMRLTTAPRYDKALQAWKREYCKELKKKDEELDGYGMCPDWILHPDKAIGQRGPNYACYDPDVTRRIAVRCTEPGGLLDNDWFGNDSWLAYWRNHRASLAFLEMEMTGIPIDKNRVDEITQIFMETKQRLLSEFRRDINWPDFNPKSDQQCRAFLFGDAFGSKKDKTTGQQVSCRPVGAVTLGLRPIKTTGKRSKLWDVVVQRGEAQFYSPSTDKEVLGIIGHAHPLAMRLRDLRFIIQVLQTVLRPPLVDDDGETEQDEDGNNVYGKGIASMAHDDGRIRTHLFTTKETGRASSARPNLQAISSRREDDYRRIIGAAVHKHPIRSIFRAPEGEVLIGCDLVGAELAVLAWMANDPLMIEHVRRNALPEDHPDFYDIHAQTACRVFNLDCPPTKKGLKDAGYKGMRVAAKNVNFGIPYGRGAEAISRQCREEGEDVSPADTQRIIDFYFSQYTCVEAFLAACRAAVGNPRFLCTAYHRYRRFIPSEDRQVRGDQERQAQNVLIQGGVADAVYWALDNFYYYRNTHPDMEYKILLQMHDAVLFSVPYRCVNRFVRETLRECMVDGVPFWPCRPDGTSLPVKEPYHFGIDHDISINWGDELSEEEAVTLGIDPALV